MLDRASTLADEELLALLESRFIPVAIDQAYQRRQKDNEGEFYRKIAGRGPRSDFKATTQGFYIATASGEFVAYNNNRGADRIKKLMQQAVAEHEPSADVAPLPVGERDKRYNPNPPDGGLVVRVRSKVLGGYEPSSDPWRLIMQSALSRDNLWITKGEHEALAAGRLLEPLKIRLARFHLVDSTRGEPSMWKEADLRQLDLRLENGELRGTVHLETASGDRGYQASVFGVIETKGGRVTKFEVAVKGEFWGEGRYARRAPKGKFPLAVAFTLADGKDVADRIPPQGSRGWLGGYLR